MFSPNLASKFTRYRLVVCFMALALLNTTEMSYASTVSFQGSSSSGTWMNTHSVAASYAQQTRITGSGTSSLSWGNPWIASGNASTATPIDAAHPQKNVTFATNTNLISDVLTMPAFSVGSLTQNNAAIFTQSEITDTTLHLSLLLGGSIKTFDYMLTSYVDTNTYSETLFFSNLADLNSRTQQFTLGEQSYLLNLLAFKDTNGAYHPGYTFADLEVTTTPMALWASITAVPNTTITPVPAPAALWLLGSGLLGLAGFAKRKRIPQ